MSSYDEILTRIPTVTVTFPASANEMEYPLNLICAILRCEGQTVTLPADYAITMEYLLFCAEQENKKKSVDVLRLRFQKGITLRAAGQIVGVNHERVRQITISAIFYLRHPQRLSWLKLGIQGQTLLIEERAHESGYEIGYKDGWDKGYTQFLEGCDQAAKVCARHAVNRTCTPLPLEEINFTARTANCLERYTRFTTTGDLILLSRNDLLKIRGFGQKSIEELCAKMREIGYDVSHWEKPPKK